MNEEGGRKLGSNTSFIIPTSRFLQVSAPDDDIEAEKKQSTVVKFVMTGSAADGADWQQHIRNTLRRKALTTRFKDTEDPFVIVRDMWLTGFGAPCLHTIYVDKTMRGQGLMQAIGRVNPVFLNKLSDSRCRGLFTRGSTFYATGTWKGNGGILAENTSQISRPALASGFRRVTRNRTLARAGR